MCRFNFFLLLLFFGNVFYWLIVKSSEFNTSHTFTIHNSTSVIDTIIIIATARIGGTAHAAVKLVQLETMQVQLQLFMIQQFLQV